MLDDDEALFFYHESFKPREYQKWQEETKNIVLQGRRDLDIIKANMSDDLAGIMWVHMAGVIPSDYFDMGNNIYLIENLIPPLDVLQISAKNEAGISSPPTFHMKPKQNFENIEGEFKIKHYEHGIIISFKEELFSGLEAYLSLKKAGVLYAHKLHRDSKLTLSSNLLSPMILEDVTEVKVYYESSIPYEIISPKDSETKIINILSKI